MDWIAQYNAKYGKMPDNATQLRSFVTNAGGSVNFKEARELVEKAKTVGATTAGTPAVAVERSQESAEPESTKPVRFELQARVKPAEPEAKAEVKPVEDIAKKEEVKTEKDETMPPCPPPPPTATMPHPAGRTDLPVKVSNFPVKAAQSMLSTKHICLLNVAEIFAACDIQQTGYVTKQELLQVCGSSSPMGSQIRNCLEISDGSSHAVEEVFNEIDADNDAKLTYEELQMYVARVREKSGTGSPAAHTDYDVATAYAHSALGRYIMLETDEGDDDDELPALDAVTRTHSLRLDSHVSHAEGETWAEFLDRSFKHVKDAGIEDEALKLFIAFLTEADLKTIFALFATALSRAHPGGSDAQEPWNALFPYDAFKSLPLKFREQRLLRLLDKRANGDEYRERPCSGGRFKGKKCVVVGAGPCGLRVAIELRLLGASVTVVEQREAFTRLNQLHVWSWVSEDIKGLGAGILSPPNSDFAADPVVLHVGIADLQTFLFKVALLLGVEIFMGTTFVSHKWEAEGWEVELTTPSEDSLNISPRAPPRIKSVAVLIPANGFTSEVYKTVDMKIKEIKTSSAIGLTCNVTASPEDVTKPVKSFAKVYQFFQFAFKEASQQVGADFENILYTKPYKGARSHYFVMTPKMQSLVALGIVKDPAVGVSDPTNVDEDKLKKLAQDAINFPWVKGEKSILAHLTHDTGEFPGWADSGPRLFDFSKTKQSEEGIVFLQPPSGGASGDQALALVLVGDALLEPFWPQGLGAIRGFFGGLDAAFALTEWCKGASADSAQQTFRSAFQQMQSLSSFSKDMILKTPDFKTYRLAPSTRYKHLA